MQVHSLLSHQTEISHNSNGRVVILYCSPSTNADEARSLAYSTILNVTLTIVQIYSLLSSNKLRNNTPWKRVTETVGINKGSTLFNTHYCMYTNKKPIIWKWTYELAELLRNVTRFYIQYNVFLFQNKNGSYSLKYWKFHIIHKHM